MIADIAAWARERLPFPAKNLAESLGQPGSVTRMVFDLGRAAAADGTFSVSDRIDELLAHNTDLVERLRDTVHHHSRQFHRALGIPVAHSPTVPTDDRVRLRLRLIAEEFFEALEAALALGPRGSAHRRTLDAVRGLISLVPVDVDLPGFIDALADIDYVVEGGRVEFGVDGRPIAREVHRSNMAKATCVKCGVAWTPAGVCVCGGAEARAVHRADGKVAKPDGWTPPDIRGELVKQGWRP